MLSEGFKRQRFTNAMNIIKAFGMSDQKLAQSRISILTDKIYRACSDDEELFKHLAKEELADYEAQARKLKTETERNDKHVKEIQDMLKATE